MLDPKSKRDTQLKTQERRSTQSSREMLNPKPERDAQAKTRERRSTQNPRETSNQNPKETPNQNPREAPNAELERDAQPKTRGQGSDVSHIMQGWRPSRSKCFLPQTCKIHKNALLLRPGLFLNCYSPYRAKPPIFISVF